VLGDTVADAATLPVTLGGRELLGDDDGVAEDDGVGEDDGV
jgi:hypothetical protein